MALQGVTAFGYDALDRLAHAHVTDAVGQTTAYQHDAFGGLTREDSPSSGATRYAYDSAGNLSQKTDAAGSAATYAYDALNRPTAIDYPGTEADVVYTYDGGQAQKGRLTGSATTVQDALKAGGINTSKTILPGTLMDNLQKQYGEKNK